jgi:hypothetical protein
MERGHPRNLRLTASPRNLFPLLRHPAGHVASNPGQRRHANPTTTAKTASWPILRGPGWVIRRKPPVV